MSFYQNFINKHSMVGPVVRDEISKKCRLKEMISETTTGKIQNWWANKHQPEEDIPTRIWTIGASRGPSTISELHIAYNNRYENIEFSDFINYTRELTKQKIMILE